jgi:adenosylcobinamide-GDP ribazoletransferase
VTLGAATGFGAAVSGGWAVTAWPAAVVAGVLASTVLLRRAVRRFGGITGDVLGALVETSCVAALVVLAR